MKLNRLKMILERKIKTRTDDDVTILFVDKNTGELIKEIDNLNKEQKQTILDWNEKNVETQ